MYCFLDFIELHVLSGLSLHFFKLIILNSLPDNSYISILGGWLLEMYCVPSMVSYIPDFFSVFVTLHWCLSLEEVITFSRFYALASVG